MKWDLEEFKKEYLEKTDEVKQNTLISMPEPMKSHVAKCIWCKRRVFGAIDKTFDITKRMIIDTANHFESTKANQKSQPKS